MIAIPRRALRRFRAAFARCTTGRMRGPGPPVVFRQARGRVTLTATFPEVTLELSCGSSAEESEVLVVPMAALDELGGATVDPIEFETTAMLKGTARWEEGGKPKSRPIDLILPGKQHEPLPRPPEPKPVPASLLAALHEAGRTSSREDGRYALSKVQVRGAMGHVIATDGKVAVIFGKFPFGFAEDALVPAVPLFSCPELRDEQDVRVGRNARHLVVQAGDWTAWLTVSPSGKFPDVAGVVPRNAPTSVDLDRGDAAKLLTQLPQLPGRDDEHRPVTLRADGVLSVSGWDEAAGKAREVALAHSPASGPPAIVGLDRRHLARILALGCTALRFTPNKAVVGEGAGVTVLAAPLDPHPQVAVEDSAPAALRPRAPDPSPQPSPERAIAMKPPEPNETARNGRHDNPQDEPPDPLVAAEELRDALGEVLAKATRLIAALKATRKEKRVLASVWAGLRQLNLNPRNGSGT